MEFSKYFDELAYDPSDPNPWLALYLDKSSTLHKEVKAALLLNNESWSRQFLLPIIRPLGRILIMLFQVIKIFIPNKFTSSKFLHYTIYWGLKYFVSPPANYLILRHFHIGSEILTFIKNNVPAAKDIPLDPLKPNGMEAIKDDLFLKHDLNIFNFIIRLNRALEGSSAKLCAINPLDFSSITSEEFNIGDLPDRFTNFLDLQSAIELYTPLYQLLLTDHDFWRASNSLQLDEIIGVYISQILGETTNMHLVNNKHPLVPLTTLGAGFRLMIHGLASEQLHGFLESRKKEQDYPRERPVR